MTEPALRIVRYVDLERTPGMASLLASGLDAVFFSSSNTQAFVDDAARQAFRERWLGRYLSHDPQLAFVAIDGAGGVAGYVVGSVDDPALAERFADIGYFQDFRHVTAQFPAHLHVNMDARFRGQGVGKLLIGQFLDAARLSGAAGVHVVTGRAARNVGFYQALGFSEQGSLKLGLGEVVFLGRRLANAGY